MKITHNPNTTLTAVKYFTVSFYLCIYTYIFKRQIWDITYMAS